MISTEPNLNDIDDYNNTEPKYKRLTVWIIVGLCLLIGAIIVASRGYFTQVNDEIVTKHETGIPKY
jgi:hypothetical protein